MDVVQELFDLGAPPCGCVELLECGSALRQCSCFEPDLKLITAQWCQQRNQLIRLSEDMNENKM